MPFTPEQCDIINRIPKDASVHDQILYLAEHGIELVDTGWGMPTEKQQTAIQAGSIALIKLKMEGGLVQR
jgi:hypothetical protein